ncbi:type IV toxin-antitoxin system AbiEi family antitoxin domain-containing protein [Nocardioides albidus]|uniref:Type IV toxin-antitoxin system AbiEi family antitoxin domain-containing protein n=1 Tax=Nocardioides albidus TaxID=1517589 RepID=A0A5C4WPC0_9ACTN|nr:type IV toxin-antitoxin system AbiEi family antitoxin domain-containing protein [Nocardioides albidus]TNM50158.1 type IV toxin-antitoxin system AbiEi family antitoxin domain-containing protein [Nocardioides albidus]
MNPRVLTAVAAGSGVIRREQLLDLGLSPADIRAQVAAGELIRLRRGVFTTGEHWTALDEYVGRPLLLARAAVTTMRRGWVLSHDSSAHAWELPILRPNDPLVHVTRPGFTNAWTEYRVRHHLARFSPSQVGWVQGLPALDLPRTAVDIARERGVVDGVVACDAAMQRGVTRLDLEAAYAIMTCWPGVRWAREAVALADPGAETVHESLTRLLVLEAGIGEPDTQFPVRTTEGIKWCDIRVGNHIVEAHGMIKLRPVADGGVATRPADEVARDQWKRERLLRDQGLGTSNVYWEDHWGARRAVAIERLRRDAAETAALRGAVLDERLARDAERIRREYGDRRRARPSPVM